jgi:glycine cleavage system H protein
MGSHDILTLYSTKAIEYGIAVAFLLLFIPFWRFVSAEAQPALAEARVRPALTDLVEWFRMARDVAFHPGHAWARAEAPGLVTVGMDDFAQKLIGPVAAVSLPSVGTRVAQGDRAWRLQVDGKAVDMLSPVDGIVSAVNHRVLEAPETIGRDPFGAGWLFKVQAPRFEANQKSLLSGTLARRWLEDATDALRLRVSPDLGLAMQDGGMPVDGLAHAIDAEHWDDIARDFLLT